MPRSFVPAHAAALAASPALAAALAQIEADLACEIEHDPAAALDAPAIAKLAAKYRRGKLTKPHISAVYSWWSHRLCPLPHLDLPGRGKVSSKRAYFEWSGLRARARRMAMGLPAHQQPIAAHQQHDPRDVQTLRAIGIQVPNTPTRPRRKQPKPIAPTEPLQPQPQPQQQPPSPAPQPKPEQSPPPATARSRPIRKLFDEGKAEP